MQGQMEAVLESRWLWLTARVLIVVVFAASGLAKLIDFDGGLAEMRQAGLEPAWLFNILVIAVLLVGALLILLDRALWLGAAALAVFLALTIVIVHHFWSLPEPQAMLSMFLALEHLSVIGGLIAVAIASHLRNQWLQAMQRWNTSTN
ncbi:DoxX family protein [Oxalicibacterium faecigallinarum]|uniref:DoxX family protein n=1 Tax=Oxalicibacterium faecigallinarum TaxID=573741 RepID=A0A8J3ANI5_9BURK|nr:DoxX family protein [Oxalicibacterium faecigallinarum]GGI15954.1 hypothetical protein GCM10008066_01540 [Oxalicibacterium faecigallinarum]